jgi:hypothetical protein
MKPFKAFYEDFNVLPRVRNATSGKDINFRGPTPSGFKGSNGLAFPTAEELLILRARRRPEKRKRFNKPVNKLK